MSTTLERLLRLFADADRLLGEAAALSDAAPDLLPPAAGEALRALRQEQAQDATRKTLQVGVLSAGGVDLARALNAILGGTVLPPDFAREPGPLLRLRAAESPDIHAASDDGDSRSWSTRHPDPRPTLHARVTALQAEKQSLVEEDTMLQRSIEAGEQEVGRLQRAVMDQAGVLGELRRDLQRARHRAAASDEAHEAALAEEAAAAAALPAALRDPHPAGLRSLAAGLLSGLHADGVERLRRAREARSEAEAAAAEARAAAEAAAAEEALGQGQVDALNAALDLARADTAAAQQRRAKVREAASRLSRDRVGIVRDLEKAEASRRRAFRAALAEEARAGAPRLWLDWPAAGLPPDVQLLLSAGVDAPDPAARAVADDRLLRRADALLLALRLGVPLAPPEAARLRRLLEAAPTLGLLLVDLDEARDRVRDPLDEDDELERVRAEGGRKIADALGLPRPARGVDLPVDRLLDGEIRVEQARRTADNELRAVLSAWRDGPRLARIARAARRQREAAARLREALDLLDAQGAREAEAFAAPADPGAALAAAHAAAAEALPELGARARAAAAQALQAAWADGADALRAEIDAAADAPALQALQEALPARVEALASAAAARAQRALGHALELGLADVLTGALAPLADRLRQVERATRPPHPDDSAPGDAEAPLPPEARARLEAVLRRASPDDATVKVALVGGAVGALLTGGLALPALAALGAVTLAGRFDLAGRRRALRAALDAALPPVRDHLDGALRASAAALDGASADRARAEVEAASARCLAWIDAARAEAADRARARAPLRAEAERLRGELTHTAFALESVIDDAQRAHGA